MNPECGGMTLSEEDRRLIGLWAADCAERVLPLFEAKAPSDTRPREAIEGIRAFALGASGQGNCALLPGRLTQPHARSAIRLPQPPLAPRPTQPRPLTSTHWRPLTRRNMPLGLRSIRRRPASSRRATTPARVTRRSDRRSSMRRRQFAGLYGGCRLAALVAVGWARSFTSSTQAFAANQRQRAATRVGALSA